MSQPDGNAVLAESRDLPASHSPQHGWRKWLYEACIRFINGLDERNAIQLRNSTGRVGVIDYPRQKIHICLDSLAELARLHPCRKEPNTVDWIERNMKPRDVFFDIGSNVGAYALIANAVAGGDCRVYAFEPSFATYSQLCKNILLNRCEDTVFPFHLALSKSSGISAFHYQSVQAGASLHALDTLLDYKGSPFKPIYSQKMLGLSLDDLVYRYGLPCPNHIKCDVDGTEFEILGGAGEVLGDPRLRSVLMEICTLKGHVEEITRMFAEKEFSVKFQIRHSAKVSDFLFMRNGAS